MLPGLSYHIALNYSSIINPTIIAMADNLITTGTLVTIAGKFIAPA